jgi:sulfofructose kinase
MTNTQSTPSIVGVGLATLDVLIRLEDMPTWEHRTPVKGVRFDGGGLVGTAMVAAAKLGAHVGFIGTAGSDEAAELKLRSFIEAGVDLSRMFRYDGPEDQVMLVYVHAKTGERSFGTVAVEKRHPLPVEELDRDYITAADYLHIDGLKYEAALAAAQWMQAAGKTVVMDGSQTTGRVADPYRELVRHVDVLITGEGYARGLTGIDDIWEAGRQVLTMGPRIFVETVGERGCYTITPDEQFHTPAFSVDVVDTTGAGDVFHGAYIVAMQHGWDVRRCARFASAVSAIKCTKLGGRAGVPTFEQTMAFLRERGGDL